MVFGAKNSGRITLKERCEKDQLRIRDVHA
jgi:hypothetical protein